MLDALPGERLGTLEVTLDGTDQTTNVTRARGDNVQLPGCEEHDRGGDYPSITPTTAGVVTYP